MQNWEVETLIGELRSYASEREWFEFKENNSDPERLGENISAVANSACLHDLSCGYIVYGIEDNTHRVVGTLFDPWKETKGNHSLLIWINTNLSPTLDIEVCEWVSPEEKRVLVFKIPSAVETPVRFRENAYVRVGNSTTLLRNYPDKERKIWQKKTPQEFEIASAAEGLSSDDIFRLIDYSVFYTHQGLKAPEEKQKILTDLATERFIAQDDTTYTITNLGALLLANDLRNFPHLEDRSLRLIHYADRTQMTFLDDSVGVRGYASAWERFFHYMKGRVPLVKIVQGSLRTSAVQYPEIALRELIGNALAHQDLSVTGLRPEISIFSDRIEILNPGKPLLPVERFMDQRNSRNPKLAMGLRAMHICERQGGGMKRTISAIEAIFSPPIIYRISEFATMAIIYAPKPFKEMTQLECVWACYQHCCWKYLAGEQTTNESLRGRFGVGESDRSVISRILADTVDASLIKEDPEAGGSRKFARYIPSWA